MRIYAFKNAYYVIQQEVVVSNFFVFREYINYNRKLERC